MFYVNSHTDKLFRKRKRICGWISDELMLWLRRIQNGDTVEWWVGQGSNDLFIAAEGRRVGVRWSGRVACGGSVNLMLQF
jgi:hypothetical protein